MILKFFNKNNQKSDTNSESINIACLLIHAAKIDENYTSEEKKIIKKTVKKLYPDLDNLDDVVSKAEQKESDSNHIQEFTKDVKSLSTEHKIIIVETLWRIILSDGKSDVYENNLMRRLAGLLYLDDKIVGEIKLKLLKFSILEIASKSLSFNSIDIFSSKQFIFFKKDLIFL